MWKCLEIVRKLRLCWRRTLHQNQNSPIHDQFLFGIQKWGNSFTRCVKEYCKNIACYFYPPKKPRQTHGLFTICRKASKDWVENYRHIPSSFSEEPRKHFFTLTQTIFNDAAIVQTLNICIFEKNAQTWFEHKLLLLSWKQNKTAYSLKKRSFR